MLYKLQQITGAAQYYYNQQNFQSQYMEVKKQKTFLDKKEFK